MRLAFFVEGLSDKKVIDVLARKVLGNPSPALDFRELGSGVRSFDVIRRHTDAVRKLHPDLSKVIVCADLHSNPTMKDEMRKTENSLRRVRLPVQVKYVKVLHAIEGWLLADADALRRSLGQNATIGDIPANLESRCDQVSILEGVFSRNRKEYNKVKWAALIAEHVQVDVVMNNMTSFRQFVDALRDN
ncbi:MAG: DUF4276 family protein [Dehalococcoidia bacterium]|nr:DUF4276 family protein [Dehalococcoidia bacterium]